MLRAKRGVRERGNGKVELDGVLVDIERLLGKSEGVQCAFGIGNIAYLEACGSFGTKIGGDEIVLGFFPRVDVEARADFQDRSNLKLAAAADGIKRNINCGSYNVLRGRNLLR